MAQGIEPAQAHRLAAMVEYGEDAIVSRVIGKGQGGNMTLFAFDAGQELSEHQSPMDAYLHVIEGEASITVGASSLTAKQGEIVLLPGGVPHSVQAPVRMKMLLTLLKKPAN